MSDGSILVPEIYDVNFNTILYKIILWINNNNSNNNKNKKIILYWSYFTPIVFRFISTSLEQNNLHLMSIYFNFS